MVALLERAGRIRCMILVSRPDFDPGTKYLSAWSLLLINEARAKKIEVMDLFARRAARRELEGRLRKKNPSLVVLNGHGNANEVCGQDNEVLIRLGENEVLLSGRTTYAIACNSAEKLGEKIGTSENSSYIGYEKEFVIQQSQGYFGHPIDDPLSKPFMEFSNQIVRSLLKGHTVEESVQRARQVGELELRKLLASSSDPDLQNSAMFLWWDMKYLKIHGNNSRKVF